MKTVRMNLRKPARSSAPTLRMIVCVPSPAAARQFAHAPLLYAKAPDAGSDGDAPEAYARTRWRGLMRQFRSCR